MSQLKEKLGIGKLLMQPTKTLEQRNELWDSTWKKYDSILSKYYNVYELYDDENKQNILLNKNNCEGITLDKITQDKITIDESYEARGNKKFFDKCLYNGKIYAINISKTTLGELKNHLDILVLYYTTYDEGKWRFKIPNVYYRKNQEYVMDFISIDSKIWTNAKSHYKFPQDLQYNIGEFLGRYIKTYERILFEFEIYKDLTDNKFVLIDFGEFNKVSDAYHKKIPYYIDIYNGIKSVLGDDITKIIDVNPAYEPGMPYSILYNKYIKYKTKYLRNLSRKI
jgi:hypothetical protein